MKNFRTQIALQIPVLAYISSQELTKAEERDMKEVFSSIDNNQDGMISKDELVNGILTLRKDEKSAIVEAEEIMNIMDINDNGNIDYNEFLMANMIAKKALTKERLDKAFLFFDTVIYSNKF